MEVDWEGGEADWEEGEEEGWEEAGGDLGEDMDPMEI